MTRLLSIALVSAGLVAGGTDLRALTTYSGEGLVLAVDREHRRATISHREIPGYMSAMAMEFAVAKGDSLATLTPGSRVTFELVVGNEGATIRHIHVVERTVLPAEAFADKPLEKEVAVGEAMPAFSAVDQDGRPFDLSTLRGRLVVVDFIYTRCPIPDACPRLSAHFAYLQKRFGERVELVSVTLDPTWDQPAVLAEYARRWAADTRHWHFLTGSQVGMRQVAERFGVRFWTEEGSITHTSSVGIMTRDGRLGARVDGTQYPARELADLIEAQLASP
jgi:protein SCO1/2